MDENIVAGLVSGLIVSFLVVIVGNIWKKIIVPWFEERVYKDVKIEGQWFSFYEGRMLGREEVIEISRHGHQIHGKLLCVSQEDHGEQYLVSGCFKNLILPLAYENGDDSKTDRGTITLKSTQSAEILKGKICYYSCYLDDVRTAEVTWFRSKDVKDKYKQSKFDSLKEGFSPEQSPIEAEISETPQEKTSSQPEN
ncbi:TPA: hypothetical protein I7206_22115 [Vibrio vulnificus]|nr:hypothetical protein [Vibrio vulnificus]EHH0747277.1 hypothetical protein [Vibrio vulnificus]HAT8535429.1 hypothetical protein [Vibrio vulnificus]